MEQKKRSNALRYVGLGFELVASLLVPILLGRWLDVYMENEMPWGTLLGALLGCVVVIYRMIKLYKDTGGGT